MIQPEKMRRIGNMRVMNRTINNEFRPINNEYERESQRIDRLRETSLNSFV